MAATCAAVALLAALAACFASQNGLFDPSALVKMSRDEPIAAVARAADPNFHFVNPQEHYDGVYYYAIARDPLLLGQAHTLIDQAAYRYGHPMYGWLAALLSGGTPRWIPWGLLGVTLLSAAWSGYGSSRLAVALGRTPWGGLIVGMTPGLLYAGAISTTEWLGVALAVSAFLAWTRHRYATAAVIIALLCLTKEQFVTVPLGLVLWEFAQWRRTGTLSRWRNKVLAVAGGPLLLAAWYLYVRARLGTVPATYEPGNFGLPGVGWREAFSYAHKLSTGSFDASQIGSTTPPMLVAIAVLVLAACAAALRLRTPLDGALLGLAVITSCMGWRTLTYSHELLRNPTHVVLLAVAVLLTRPGKDSTAETAGLRTTGLGDVDHVHKSPLESA